MLSPVVIVALGKIVAPERRSFILGLGTAAASFGMFAAAPASQALIARLGWQVSIFVIAASFLLILPTLVFIARIATATAASQNARAFGRAVRGAFRDRSYVLLFIGFFVCGFHVAFIQTHLPAYVVDRGLALAVGGWSLALIGLFNIAGSFLSGWSGQRLSKKNVLSSIYISRSAVIAVFILTPISPASVYVFSALMGLLWLSTVPLTTGLVAQTQGPDFPVNLVGSGFLKPSDRQFHRRLAGRPDL